MDFFGNPPGWVPLLSFEASYATYQAETKEAVRLLVMSHWLEQYWHQQDTRQDSIKWTIEQTQELISQLQERVGNAQRLLPALQKEAEQLKSETNTLLALLRASEQRITEAVQAKRERERVAKALFDALGASLGLVMFTQPGAKTMVAAITGTGASTLASGLVGTAAATASGTGASDILQQYLDEESLAATKRQLAALDLYAGADTEPLIRELSRLGQDLSVATRQFIEQQMRDAMAGSTDFAAAVEINAALAADPEFNGLFQRIIALTTKRQLFTHKALETKSVLEDAIASMITTHWQLSSLQDAQRDNSARIDQYSRGSVRQLRRQAIDRLSRYQYYLAKSFEYRMLQPSPIDPFANRLYTHVESLFGLPAPASDDPNALRLLPMNSKLVDELVLIYQQDLRRLARLTLEGLEGDRFDPVRAHYAVELTDTELARLNQTGVTDVVLQQHNIIFASDRNARIISLAVDEDASRFVAASGVRAHMDLSIEPAVASYIKWKDTAYGFTFRRPLYTSMVMWGYNWQAPNGPGEAMVVGDESRSLMATLVDPNLADKSRVQQLRFRPSAHGALVIHREVSGNTPATNIDVQRLVLQVEIQKNKSFSRRS